MPISEQIAEISANHPGGMILSTAARERTCAPHPVRDRMWSRPIVLKSWTTVCMVRA